MALSRVKSDLIVKLDASKVVGALPALVGTNLLGVSAGGADQASRNNLALNFFEDTVRDNIDRLSLSQGWVDTFEDASDVVNEGYSLQSTRFSGDLYQRNAALSGATNGKKGIISFWMDFNGVGISAGKYIFSSTGANNHIGIDGAHRLAFGLKNADGAGDITFYGTKQFANADGWYHVLASYDLGGSGTVLDNVDMWITPLGGTEVSDHNKATGTYVNTNVKYTESIFAIGGVPGTPSSMYRGSLAQFYWNYTEYLDISVEANRRKFTTADGYPINFGSTGSEPTGTQPIAYFDGDLSINKGTGGNLDVTDTIHLNGLPSYSGYLDLSGTTALYSSESFTNTDDILIDSYRTLTGGAAFFIEEVGNTGHNSMAGQCINLPTDSFITKMAFHVFETGSPPIGSGQAIIMGVTGTVGTNAVGNDNVIASVPFNITTMGTSPSMIEYTFGYPVDLPAGDYFFGMQYDALDGNGARRLRMQSDTSSPFHSGNVAVKDQGGNWTAAPTRDLAFRLYGQKNLDLVTKGSDDIGNSPAAAPDTGHIELLVGGGKVITAKSYAPDVEDFGYNNTSVRVRYTATTSATRIRLKLKGALIGGDKSNMHLANISIGNQSGESYNCTAVPTEIFTGGVSGIFVRKGQYDFTDWFNYTIVAGSSYLITFDFETDAANDDCSKHATAGDGAVAQGGGRTYNLANFGTIHATYATGVFCLDSVESFDSLDIGTLNTDIIAEMSRDGGTTYSPATLNRLKTRVGATSQNIIGGAVDFDGDPSGTNIVGRVRSVNKDKITVHGVSVNWS